MDNVRGPFDLNSNEEEERIELAQVTAVEDDIVPLVDADEVAPTELPSEIIPDPITNVVELPESITSLEGFTFEIDGSDLLMIAANGDVIRIVGGADQVPTFLIGEVELPTEVVALALGESDINIAADGSATDGPPDGSGQDLDSVGAGLNVVDGNVGLLGNEGLFGQIFAGRNIDPNIDTAPIAFDLDLVALGVIFDDEAAVVGAGNTGNAGGDGDVVDVRSFTAPAETLFTFPPVNNFTALFGSFTFNDLATLEAQLQAVLPASDGTDTSVENVVLTQTITATGTTLTATGADSGQQVFVIEVAADGSFTFELFAALVHSEPGTTEETLSLAFSFTVADIDGDEDSATLTIGVNDDTPVIESEQEVVQAVVDEDNLEEGNNDTTDGDDEIVTDAADPDPTDATVFGDLNISWGSDNADAAVDTDTAQDTPTSEPGNRSVVFATSEGTDEPVVSISTDLDNTDSPDPFVLRSEGSEISFVLNADKTILLGYVGDVIVGEDGSIFNALQVSDGAYSSNVIFAVSLFDEDSGSFKFELFGALDHPTADTEDNIVMNFGFVATDSDGDPISSAFEVSIDDDAPVIDLEAIAAGEVDEDALPTGELGGNDDSSVDTVFTGGSLGISWGADDGDTPDEALDDQGILLSQDAPGGLGNRSVTFASTETGPAVSVSAFASGDDAANNANGTEVTALTSGGETIKYAMNEDGTALFGYIGEDATFEELIRGEFDPDDTVENNISNNVSGNVIFAVVLSDDDAGTYAFALLGPLDHPTADVEDDIVMNFTYIATDSDGDTTSASFNVTIDDDSPVFSDESTGSPQLDEEGVQDGIGNIGEQYPDTTGGQSDFATGGNNDDRTIVTRDLNVLWGADDGNSNVDGGIGASGPVNGDRALTFTEALVTLEGNNDPDTMTSHGEVVLFRLNDTGTVLEAYVEASDFEPTNGAGERLIFTISLSDEGTGSYTFELLDALDHNITDAEDNLRLEIGITATDADGDSETSSFQVRIDDDGPAFGEEGVEATQVDEEGVEAAAGNIGEQGDGGRGGRPDYGTGVDGEDDRTIVTQTLNVLWGADDANAVVDGGVDAQGPVNGDRALTFTNNIVTLTGGNDPDTLTSHGETVEFRLNDTGTELVGFVANSDFDPTNSDGERLVLTVSLSDEGTGSYTFEILDALDHNQDDIEDNLRLEFNITATDSDGDTSDSTFEVVVDDDAPAVGEADNGIVEEEDFFVTGRGNEDFRDANGLDGDFSFRGFPVTFITTNVDAGDLDISWGADDGNSNADGTDQQNGDRTVRFDTTNPFQTTDGAPTELTSNGDEVKFVILQNDNDQDVLLAYTGDTEPSSIPAGIAAARAANVVFLVGLSDADTGSYQFILIDTLDHPDDHDATSNANSRNNEDLLGLQFNLVVTDSDGDSVEHSFDVGVIDDSPFIFDPETEFLDEDGRAFTPRGGLAESNPGSPYGNDDFRFATTDESGDLNIAWGGDDGNSSADGGFNGTQVDGDRSVVFGYTTGGVAQYLADGALSASDADALIGVPGPLNEATLSSDGDTLTYVLSGNGTVLTAVANFGSLTDARDVFRITLSDTGSGEYRFELLDNLDHPVVDAEDNLRLNFDFIARDGDGDSITDTFSVVIDDDAPIIGSAASATVDEDDLSTASARDLADGNADTATGDNDIVTDTNLESAASDTDPTTVRGDLAISFGADNGNSVVDGGTSAGNGDRAVTFSSDAISTLLALNLTSEGADLTYALSANDTVLTASAGGRVIFTVTLSDQDTGSYVFDLNDVLDHPTANTEDNIDLVFNFTATDSDGDTASSSFTVTVDDDSPVIGAPAAATVDEDDLSTTATSDLADGNADTATGDNDIVTDSSLESAATDTDPTTVRGNLNISFGADDANSSVDGGIAVSGAVDGDRAVTFASDAISTLQALNLTSEGAGLTYALSANDTVLTASAGGRVIFTVTLSDQDTGSYVFDLNDVLDHPTANTEDNIDLVFNFTATDSDGDTASSSFTVTVDDDSPVIGAPAAATVDEDDLSTASARDLADGNADTATGDADVVTDASLESAASDTDPTTVRGNLNISFGADDANSSVDGGIAVSGAVDGDRAVTFASDAISTLNALSLTSQGETISYALSANDTVLTASAGGRVIFTVTLSDQDTGSYVFDLNDVLDHPSVDTEDNIDLVFNFTATDSDGDTASSSFTVTVDDDLPVVTAAQDSVVEEERPAPQGGNEDGGDADGLDLDATQPGQVITQTSNGSLNISWGADDGNSNAAGTDQQDGDRSVRFVLPQTPVALTSRGEALEYVVVQNATDQDILIAYVADGSGAPIFGDPINANGNRLVFTVELSDDGAGSYEFNLLDTLDHTPFEATSNANARSNEDNIDLTFDLLATDSDGDTVTQSFTVEVIDDSVLVGTAEDSVVEEERPAAQGGNEDGGDADGLDLDATQPGQVITQTSNGSLNISWGADDANSNAAGTTQQDGDRTVRFALPQTPVALTSRGETVEYVVVQNATDQDVLIAYVADGTGAPTFGDPINANGNRLVFTVELSDDGAGSYEFNLLDTLDHTPFAASSNANARANEDNIDLNFDLVVTDSDGDSVPHSFTVEVIDDSVQVDAVADASVDEEVIDGNIDDGYAGDIASTGLTIVGQDLNIRWGADDNNTGTANRSVVFDASQPSLAGLTSNGAAVSIAVLSNGDLVGYTGSTVPTATGDASVVFFASLSDVDSGSYDFTLVDNLDHDTADTEDDITLTFALTVSDSDGDSVPHSFNVIVDDDGPATTTPDSRELIDEDGPIGDAALGLPGNNPGDSYSGGDYVNGTTQKFGPLGILWGADDGNSNVDGGFSGTQVDGDRSVAFNTSASDGVALDAATVDSFISLRVIGLSSSFLASALTSRGETLSYVLSEGGSVLTAQVPDASGGPAREVFKITLSDDAFVDGDGITDGSGEYKFELLDVLDHARTDLEDTYEFDFLYIARDGDGDSVVDNFKVAVNDDAPVANDVTATDQTDDEGKGAFASESNPGVELTATTDNDFDDTDGMVTGSAGSLFNSGADGTQSIQVSLSSPSGLMAIYKASDGTPAQETVTITSSTDSNGVETLTATGDVSSATVFTLVIGTDGSYTFTQGAALVHGSNDPTESDDLSLVFNFTVTDGDNDTDSGTLTINVDDDTPEIYFDELPADQQPPLVGSAGVRSRAAEITNTRRIISDDDTVGDPDIGNAGGTQDSNEFHLSGKKLPISFGADGGTVAWDPTSSTTDSGATGVSFALKGDGSGTMLILQDQGDPSNLVTIAEVTLDKVTGDYSFNQLNNLLHDADNTADPSNNATGVENDATFTLAYRATDGDGDTLDSYIPLIIDDDTAVVTENRTIVSDDDNVGDPDSGNPGRAGFQFDDGTFPTTRASYTDIGDGEGIAAGTDAGDQVESEKSGTLDISFGADGGTVEWVAASSSNDGGASNTRFEVNASGALELIQVQNSSDVVIVEVTLNADTGAYEVIHRNALMHDDAGDANDENNATFTLGFLVTDGDDDTVSGAVTLVLDDDTPVIRPYDTNPDRIITKEGVISGGSSNDTGGQWNKSKVLENDVSFGADGKAATGAFAWVGGSPEPGFTFTPNADGTLLSIYQDQGGSDVLVATISMNSNNGSYTVTEQANVLHDKATNDNIIDLTIQFAITDGDGDTVVGDRLLRFRDDVPTVTGGSVSAATHDEAIIDTTVNTDQATGTLTFSAGADGATITDVVLTEPGAGLTHDGNAITVVKTVGTGTITFQGTVDGTALNAFTLIVNTDTGAYTYEQHVSFDHPIADSIDGDDTLDIGLEYTVTDGDGDTATATTQITIEDDGPVATSTGSGIDFDEATFGPGVGDIVEGQLQFTPGVDGAEVTAASVESSGGKVTAVDVDDAGAPFNLTVAGNTVSLSTTTAGGGFTIAGVVDSVPAVEAFRIVVDPDGSYTYEQFVAFDHPDLNESDADDQIALQLNFTVTDGDDDTSSSFALINIADDAPVLTWTDSERTNNFRIISDDDTVGTPDIGNPGGVNDSDEFNQINKTLPISFGADSEGATVVWNTATSQVLGGVAGTGTGFGEITFSVAADPSDSDLSILSILQDQGGASPVVVAEVTLNTLTGNYNYVQVDNLLHADGGDENDATFELGFTAIDGDGDEVEDFIPLIIDDDTPELTWTDSQRTNNFRIISDDDTVGDPDIGNTGGVGDSDEFNQTNKTLPISFGADSEGATVVWNTATSQVLGGVAGTGTGFGEITFSVAADPSDSDLSILSILQDQGGASPVVVAEVTLNTLTGNYNYVQVDNLLHADGGDENDATFELGFTAIDGDGDEVDDFIPLIIDDDTPELTWTNSQRTNNFRIISDDETVDNGSGGIIGNLGFGSNTSDGADSDSREFNQTNKTLPISFGADTEGATVVWNTATSQVLGGVAGTGTGFGEITFSVAADPSDSDLSILSILQDQGGASPVVVAEVTLNTLTGNYNYEQVANLLHADGSDENNATFELGFTAIDGDGDEVDDYIPLNIDDDTAVLSSTTAQETISEDGTLVLTDIDLDVSWGADANNSGSADRSLDFANVTGTTANAVITDHTGTEIPLLSGGLAVNVSVINGELVGYTGTAPANSSAANVVFVASLSDLASGSFSFELKQPLDHTAPNTTTGDHYIDLEIGFTATDADGDTTDASSFTVRVDAAGVISSIDYSALSTGVFVNLDSSAQTESSQTVAGQTATDVTGQGPIVGVDDVTGIDDATGSTADDILIGNANANTLKGDDGSDIINGLAGNDMIEGGAGDDTSSGGDDADTFVMENNFGNDNIDGGSGGTDDDTLDMSAVTANLTFGGSNFNSSNPNTVSDGSDTASFTEIENIVSGSGNDVFNSGRALANTVSISMGEGDDTYSWYSSTGNSLNINAGAGNDAVSIGAAAGVGGTGLISGTVDGGDDTDTLNILLNGGNGTGFNLTFTGDKSGTVAYNGGNATVTNFVDFEVYNFINYLGTDDLVDASASTADLTINTARGDDKVISGTGNNTIDGGNGTDTISYEDAASAVTVDLSNTGAQNTGGSGTDTLSNFENLTGSAFNDTLTGNSGNNVIMGLDGNDDIEGGAGNDVIDGGIGEDTALYTQSVTPAMVSAVADADPNTSGSQAGWAVVTGGSEGSDNLLNTEIIEHAGGKILLVGNGGFATIQEAVDAASAGDVVMIAPGSYAENVVVDLPISIIGSGNPGDVTINPASGSGISVQGNIGATETVTIDNITFDGSDVGVAATSVGATVLTLGELEILNSVFSNNDIQGVFVNGKDNGVGKVTVKDSTFTDNGDGTSNGDGDIVLFEYRGDATIQNVAITNATGTADTAIQIAGFEQTDYDVESPIGVVLIENVSVNGSFSKVGVYIQGYTDLTDLTFNGVSGSIAAGWGYATFINPTINNLATNPADVAGYPGAFDVSSADGSVDLSTVTLVNTTAISVALTHPLAAFNGVVLDAIVNGTPVGETITATQGDDLIAGLAGNDIIDGDAGDDTIIWSVGDGRDIVDGGVVTDTDTFIAIGNGVVGEEFLVETRAAYIARTSLTLEADTEIVVSRSDDAGVTFDVVAELDNIDDIVINGVSLSPSSPGVGVTVSGNFSSTDLDAATITVVGTTGNDTINVANFSGSNTDGDHHVLFMTNGGQDRVEGVRAQDKIDITGQTVSGVEDLGSGEYRVDFASGDSVTFTGGTPEFVTNGGTPSETIVNLPPIAADDTASGDEDNNILGNVLGNDVDPNAGDTLTVLEETKATSNGSVQIFANGNFVYTPNANYNGTDSFTYTVSDDDGASDTATVNLTVNPVNDAPEILGLIDGVVAENDAGVLIDTFTVNDVDTLSGLTFRVLQASGVANDLDGDGTNDDSDTEHNLGTDDRFEVVAANGTVFGQPGTYELRLKSGSSLDFETETNVNLAVEVNDNGSENNIKIVPVDVSVTDVAENSSSPTHVRITGSNQYSYSSRWSGSSSNTTLNYSSEIQEGVEATRAVDFYRYSSGRTSGSWWSSSYSYSYRDEIELSVDVDYADLLDPSAGYEVTITAEKVVDYYYRSNRTPRVTEDDETSFFSSGGGGAYLSIEFVDSDYDKVTGISILSDPATLGALETRTSIVNGNTLYINLYTTIWEEGQSVVINVGLDLGTDPIIIDLDGDGAETLAASAGITFDIDADGDPDQIGWVGADDGVLAVDLDGSGAIENGNEVFSAVFNGGDFDDSLDALRSLDDNGDGVIDANDAAFADILVWQDANSDGQSDAGELKTLTELGITSLDLNAADANRDDNGNTIFAEGTYTKTDGGVGSYVGVDFGVQQRRTSQDHMLVVIGAVATMSLLANDVVAAQAVSLTIVSQPNHGTVVVNDDMTVSFTSTGLVEADDSFEYQVIDQDGNVHVETVSVTIGTAEFIQAVLAENEAAIVDPSSDNDGSGSTDQDLSLLVADGEGEVIFGTDGDDVLIGTDGNDVLIGGAGADVLTGGEGADTFVIDATALTEVDMADVITDFDNSEDLVDLSDLLATAFGDDVSSATHKQNVKLTTDGENSEVVVTDGNNEVSVVKLHGVHTAVNILYSDDDSSTIV